MPTINSYLTFNGNCREAMTFYRDCLEGELTLETIADSPMGTRLPCAFQSLIVQATLTRGDITIIGSDMATEKGLKKGNAIAMMLHCDSDEEARLVYRRLSSGGKETHPLSQSHWGTLFGELVDKFGNHWLIQYESNDNYYYGQTDLV